MWCRRRTSQLEALASSIVHRTTRAGRRPAGFRSAFHTHESLFTWPWHDLNDLFRIMFVWSTVYARLIDYDRSKSALPHVTVEPSEAVYAAELLRGVRQGQPNMHSDQHKAVQSRGQQCTDSVSEHARRRFSVVRLHASLSCVRCECDARRLPHRRERVRDPRTRAERASPKHERGADVWRELLPRARVSSAASANAQPAQHAFALRRRCVGRSFEPLAVLARSLLIGHSSASAARLIGLGPARALSWPRAAGGMRMVVEDDLLGPIPGHALRSQREELEAQGLCSQFRRA